MLPLHLDDVLTVLAGVAAILLLWRWYEPRLIYFPNTPTRAIEQKPDTLDMAYEDVELVTSDGERLNGWWLPCRSALGDTPRWTVLFLHGNAGNISHRFEKYNVLHTLGADVFAIDYRGFGNSTGRPTEAGLYLDAGAAYDFLLQQRALSPSAIAVYGESLGTAVAAELASRAAVGRLVLEAPFTSIAAVGRRLLPFLPVRLIARSRYDTLSKMPQVQAPLLILHSTDDEYFPMTFAQQLLSAAGGPKQLVQLHGSHDNAYRVSAETYAQALTEFLGTSVLP